MTGKEKTYESIRRYELMREVLQVHIDDLRKKLRKNAEVNGDFIQFQLALRSWIESEEDRILSSQMKELDAEVIRFRKDIVSKDDLIKFLDISGVNFIADVMAEKRRLKHRLELCDLLTEMRNQGETMPDVINTSKVEKYLIDC